MPHGRLMILIALSLAGCRPPRVIIATDDEWKVTALSGINARVEVPPEARVQVSQSGGVALYQVLIDTTELCRVFANDTGVQGDDFPAAKKAVRAMVKEGGAFGGTIMQEHEVVDAQGRPCIEYIFLREGGRRESARLFVSEGWLFLVHAAMRDTGELSPAAERCLHSFRVETRNRASRAERSY